ncbi:hypothetical protein KP509_23G055400 [Ceratopteris richardii]|nr:hypothetical protein KP509_23G055400 [Ceratopteris richardii]
MAMDSPMWETLHFCLQKLDEPVMEKLVPRLIQLVRSGVGLNTRVGVSRFIDLMMHQHGPQMKKFTGVLLKVLKTAAQEEKSPAARQALVSACVSVAKYADNTQVQSLVEDVITLFNENIPNTKITSALLLKGLSNQAHNIFVGYHALVLPSAFIARFDDDKTVSNMFEELWEESISGESIALQLYAAEIVQLAIKGLSNTSWTHKKRCARALTRLAETAGPSIAPYVEPLLSALLEELPGHLWEGKEVLLDAVSAICRCYSTTISECSEVKKVDWQTIGSAVLTACSKRKTNYRNAALSCLEQVFLHCDNETVHCEAFSFLLQHCSTTVPSKGEIHDGNQVDGNIASSLEKTLLSFKANLQHVSICIIRNRFEELTSCLAEKLTGSYTWQIKLATVATIQELVGRISKDGYDEGHMHIVKSMEQLLLGLLECIRSVKVGQVRITCLQCMSALLEAGKWEIGKAVKECLLLLSELERDPSVKAVMETLLTTLSSNTTDLATT